MGYRTAVGKSKRGGFRFKRADELAAETIKYMMEKLPELDVNRIDDVIVGNAMPEGSQGLNMACIIAGGTESMTSVPMTGFKPELNYNIVNAGNEDYYWGMGNTAEAVAEKYNVSRADQDEFAFQSHMKALKALDEDRFQDQIVPIEVEETYIDAKGKKATRKFTVNKDEGPRRGTSVEALAKLRPVFAANGSVTAGNSSQTSDGSAFVMVMSEDMVKELKLEPIARMVSYAAAGVPPRIMGIGPVAAIPKALKQAGLQQSDINLIELNEAFASQSLAVIRELDLNPDIINVNGGAIALGHPLGCTG